MSVGVVRKWFSILLGIGPTYALGILEREAFRDRLGLNQVGLGDGKHPTLLLQLGRQPLAIASARGLCSEELVSDRHVCRFATR